MRPRHLTLAAVSLATAVLALGTSGAIAGAGGGGGGGEPVIVLDDYCSPTGDVCLTAFVLRSKTKLQIAIERVSGEYELCVRGPERKRCEDFKLRPGDEGIYTDRVDLRRKFGQQGSGRYKAVWKIDGDRVGEPLRFKSATVG